MTSEARRTLVEVMISSGQLSLHKCPNTGRIIESTGSDDKASCPCGKTPPGRSMEKPGVHVKAFLKRASVDEYIAQGAKR